MLFLSLSLSLSVSLSLSLVRSTNNVTDLQMKEGPKIVALLRFLGRGGTHTSLWKEPQDFATIDRFATRLRSVRMRKRHETTFATSVQTFKTLRRWI